MTSSLYENDYYLWLKTTVHHLRDRAEKIDCLMRSLKDEFTIG